MLTLLLRVRLFKVDALKLSKTGSRGYVTCLNSAKCDSKQSFSYSDSLIQWIEELKANTPVIVKNAPLGSRLHVLLRHGRKWMKGRSSKPSNSRSRAINRERVCMSITPYVFNDCTVVKQPSETVEDDVTVQSLSVQNMKTLLEMGYQASSLDQLLDLSGATCGFSHPYSYTGDDISIVEGNLSQSQMSPVNLEELGSVDVKHMQHDVAEVCVGNFYDDDIICRDSFQVNMSCSSAGMENTGYELLCQAMSESTWKDKTDGFPMLFSPFNDTMNQLQCSSPMESSPEENPPEGRYQKPNQDELTVIQEHMENYLPKVFKKGHNYRLYRPDVIFENNFSKQPKTTVGLTPYAIEIAKLRMFAHFKYANVRLQVLKITTHLDDGSVCVHWRVSGISQKRAFMFWKFLPWVYRKSMTNEAEWTDGISTFYVTGGDGLISKHKLDRVILDREGELKLAEEKKLAAKLGLAAS